MEILANFLVNFINDTLGKLVFFKVCRKGDGIIRTFLGKPIYWSSEPTIYFNWPFVQELLRVDLRRKYATLYAHSFHFDGMESCCVPYNIIVDLQVEYQILHPYIIFEVENEVSNPLVSERNFEIANVDGIIENIIHSKLAEFIRDCGGKISYDDLCLFVKSISEKYNREQVPECESEFKLDESFSINNLVITSFDKNITLRKTT